MEIRPARRSDAQAITLIHNQSIPLGTSEWTEQPHTVDGRSQWLAQKFESGSPVLIAESIGEVVGVATFGDFRDSERREGFRFTVEHSVYVHEAHHGRGVATSLMDTLESLARERGLHVMIGAVDGANEGSLAFHRRRGYVEVGRLPDVGFTFGTWRTLVLVQLML